jgi:sulfite exporter TauE/SafE
MRLVELAAGARLDLGEVLRSRWLVLCLVLYALLGGVFVLVGMRESNVLGFTGVGRVLFSLCHALVLFLPLGSAASAGRNRARRWLAELYRPTRSAAAPISRGSPWSASPRSRFRWRR